MPWRLSTLIARIWKQATFSVALAALGTAFRFMPVVEHYLGSWAHEQLPLLLYAVFLGYIMAESFDSRSTLRQELSRWREPFDIACLLPRGENGAVVWYLRLTCRYPVPKLGLLAETTVINVGTASSTGRYSHPPHTLTWAPDTCFGLGDFEDILACRYVNDRLYLFDPVPESARYTVRGNPVVATNTLWLRIRLTIRIGNKPRMRRYLVAAGPYAAQHGLVVLQHIGDEEPKTV